MVVEPGDHRADRDPHRDAGVGEPADRQQPPLGGGGPRLHRPGELAVERRHREPGRRDPHLRHLAEDVGIALDQRALGQDRHRVAEVLQHPQDRAHDRELLLDRLVGVGVGPHRDRVGHVAPARELGRQHLGRLGLRGQPGLEVEAGRQAEIGMRRAGEAVDAAVLAAAVGIDRAVEGNVRARVAGDDRPRPFDRDLGAGDRRRLVEVPAVVDRHPIEALEPPGHVEPGAARLAGGFGDPSRFVADHPARLEQMRNIRQPVGGGGPAVASGRGAVAGAGIGG